MDRKVHGSAPAPSLEVPVRHHATPQRHGAADQDNHRPEHIYEDGARTRGLLQWHRQQTKKKEEATAADQRVIEMRDGVK